MKTAILDTGPLVALLSENDQYHAWAKETGGALTGPLHTCDSVLSEAFFLLSRLPGGCQRLRDALRKPDLIVIPWRLDDHRGAVLTFLEKYRDTPASLADACLVRMAETCDNPVVWTTDHHFSIYRYRGRHKIPILAP